MTSKFIVVPKTPGERWPKWVIEAVASQITSSRKYTTDARLALDALEKAIKERDKERDAK